VISLVSELQKFEENEESLELSSNSYRKELNKAACVSLGKSMVGF